MSLRFYYPSLQVRLSIEGGSPWGEDPKCSPTVGRCVTGSGGKLLTDRLFYSSCYDSLRSDYNHLNPAYSHPYNSVLILYLCTRILLIFRTQIHLSLAETRMEDSYQSNGEIKYPQNNPELQLQLIPSFPIWWYLFLRFLFLLTCYFRIYWYESLTQPFLLRFLRFFCTILTNHPTISLLFRGDSSPKS